MKRKICLLLVLQVEALRSTGIFLQMFSVTALKVFLYMASPGLYLNIVCRLFLLLNFELTCLPSFVRTQLFKVTTHTKCTRDNQYCFSYLLFVTKCLCEVKEQNKLRIPKCIVLHKYIQCPVWLYKIILFWTVTLPVKNYIDITHHMSSSRGETNIRPRGYDDWQDNDFLSKQRPAIMC